ncbi:DUF397 domain-containing protein [Nocardia sp. NPDC059180]|uniref:DUF397 domain-containing protein n=1 Tax=Nocardia sp. NPDC059180 TaxID=3346761 RepID=UPI003696A974
MSTTAHSTPRSGWFKSSFSKESTSCVEVKFSGDWVLIRDSKYLRDPANNPADQPVIPVRADDWMAFLSAAAGQIPGHRRAQPRIERTATAVLLHSADITLAFTPAEWNAFTEGVVIGEFAAA